MAMPKYLSSISPTKEDGEEGEQENSTKGKAELKRTGEKWSELKCEREREKEKN